MSKIDDFNKPKQKGFRLFYYILLDVESAYLVLKLNRMQHKCLFFMTTCLNNDVCGLKRTICEDFALKINENTDR